MIVAKGATNREAAMSLFVSEKAIESTSATSTESSVSTPNSSVLETWNLPPTKVRVH
jgi:hypothetical protein